MRAPLVVTALGLAVAIVLAGCGDSVPAGSPPWGNPAGGGAGAGGSGGSGAAGGSAGDAPFDRLEVLPEDSRIAIDEALLLGVVGVRADGSRVDLAEEALFGIDPPGALLDAGAGLFFGHAVGPASIRVQAGGLSAEVRVLVEAAAALRVVGFELVPDYEVLGLGEEGQLSALGTLEDGTVVDLSCASAYESSDPTVVEVRGCGVITGISPGDELVHAVSPDGLLEATARVSARERQLLAIDVICPETIAIGESRVIEVWARFRGSSDEELSFDPAAVTFVNLSPGLLGGEGPSFTGLAAGRATIEFEVVRYAHASGGCGIEVVAPPSDLRVLAGETVDLPLGVPEFDSIVVEAGGRLLVTHGNEVVARRVVIDGTLEVSGKPGVAGLAVAAPGGAGGPRAGGGGGGADGDTLRPAEGGAGFPAGSAAASAAGAGTTAGDGGGAEGGLGAAGGCARGGGGGGLRGAGGRGGGEAGFATGAAGGPANVAGWGTAGGTGGGGGSTCGNNSGGGGGGGGGMLVVRAESIEIRGQVRADGGPGGAGFTGSGGGGGGSGGTIALDASTSLLLTGTLSARGAAGGDAPDGAAGGGGGGGQILLVEPGGVDVSAAVLDVSGGDGGTSPVGAGEAGGAGVIDLT